MALRDERAVQRALKRFADVRRDLEAEVLPSIVVGRNEDGSAQLLGLHGECVARGGAGGYQGEIVTRLPSLTGRQGTTGAALLSNRGSLGTVWLEAVDPYPLPRGASGLTVTLTGGGFTANTLFDFLAEGSEDDLNPDVTVTGRTFLDSETVELTVSVAADADLFPWATVTYGDPAVAGSIGSAAGAGKTQLRLRKERAYGVGLPEFDLYAFFFDTASSTMAAATYNGATYGALRGTQIYSGVSALDSWRPILSDPVALVGVGSLATLSEGPAAYQRSLQVWDVEGGTLHTTTIGDATWNFANGCWPVDGWLYWVEFSFPTPYGSLSMRLRRCRYDLTSAETVVTATNSSISTDAFPSNWAAGFPVLVSSEAVKCYELFGTRPDCPAACNTWYVRLPFTGAATETDAGDQGSPFSAEVPKPGTANAALSWNQAGVDQYATDGLLPLGTPTELADFSGMTPTPGVLATSGDGATATLHPSGSSTVYRFPLPSAASTPDEELTLGTPGDGLDLADIYAVFPGA